MRPGYSPRPTARLGAFVIASLGVAVFSTPAEAQVTPDELGFSLVSSAEYKRSKPMIVVEPVINVKGLTFSLKRNDGKRIKLRGGNIRAGKTKRIAIPQGKGIYQYTCAITGKAGKKKFGPFNLTFEIKVGQPPRFSLSEKDVNEPARTVTVRSSEPKGKIELTVFGDDGEVIDEVEQEYAVSPGTPIVVKWKQTKQQVMGQFQLKIYDQVGFYSGLESITFVNIPHDDIIFESGKWVIPAAEQKKLSDPLSRIKAALAKVRGVLPIKLFVGGYTDTVGSAADNLVLSRKRAASIAKWFKKHGVNAPIRFQGFGEQALFVKTPDSTDEKRNRRAVYVLSKDLPPASRGFPKRSWKSLR